MDVNNKVLVVDAMAIVHNIANELQKLDALPPIEQYVNAQLEWLGSGLWWQGFEGVFPNVVFCWDSKPYWRHEYLLRDEVWSNITPLKRGKPQAPAPIHYKGGRSMPPVVLSVVKAEVSRRVQLKGWHVLKRMANDTHGYEADDLAALLVQVNRTYRLGKHIYLCTRDKDWMGLIGEDTTWLCCNTDTPRVRTMDNWASCFKTPLRIPSDIWTYKAATGDASDNLPNCGGCPASATALLPVISLFDPPEEYDLTLNQDCLAEAHRVLQTPCAGAPNVAKAIKALRSKGLRPCIQPFFN